MEDNPKILLINLLEGRHEDVLEIILGSNPKLKAENEYYKAYEWKMNNKYYTATVDICVWNDSTMIQFDVANSNTEALVVNFDANDVNVLHRLHDVMNSIKGLPCGIQILTCNTFNDNNLLTEGEIQKWCIDEEFELIELNPLEEDCLDVGKARLTQALQAHHWSNMIMKSDDTSSKEQSNSDVLTQLASETSNLMIDDLGGDHDDFENILHNLQNWRGQAGQLNDTERKQFAEKVVLSFWNSVQGDAEEVEGINES